MHLQKVLETKQIRIIIIRKYIKGPSKREEKENIHPTPSLMICGTVEVPP